MHPRIPHTPSRTRRVAVEKSGKCGTEVREGHRTREVLEEICGDEVAERGVSHGSADRAEIRSERIEDAQEVRVRVDAQALFAREQRRIRDEVDEPRLRLGCAPHAWPILQCARDAARTQRQG